MPALERTLKVLVAVFFVFNAVFLPFTGIAGAQVGNLTNGSNATETNATNATGDTLTGAANNATNVTNSTGDELAGAANNTSEAAPLGSLRANGNSTNSSNATNATNSTNATNATAANSSAGGAGGGNCGVTNPGGCIPSIEDMIDGAIQYVVGGITENLKGIVQSFSDMMVGLPAPGDGWDVSTWANPDNGWWPGIYQAYAVFSGISIALLGLAFMYAYETTDRYKRRKRLKRLALHAVMILFGAIIIIPASLHFFDTLAESVAPSANEFFSSPGDLGKLGVGIILGGALAFFQSSIVLVGIGVLLAIFVAIHFLVAFWPLFWVARLAPISSVEWVGNAGIAAFYALCVMRVLQSAFLRVMFALPWDPVTTGAGSAIAALIMTIIGLYIAFITLPKTFAKKAIPGVQMLSSGSPSSQDIREGYQESRQRIGNVKGRFEQVRGGSSGGTTPAHKREGGTSSFQSRAYAGSNNSPTGNIGEVTGSSNRSLAGNSGGGSSSSSSGSGSSSGSQRSESSNGADAGTWDNRRYKARKAARRGHQ